MTFNVLLDRLPTEYQGYLIDSDFQIGIQMFQALSNKELSKQERIGTALSLLFPQADEQGNELPIPDVQIAIDGMQWFLNGWKTDRYEGKDSKPVMDFDVDQWRIYSAFRSQYGINLNTDKVHFWEFMALLSTLEECAFTRVADIRKKAIDPKMSAKEKQALSRAKRMYALEDLEEEISAEDQAAIDAFRQYHKKAKR